jgi:hypothetical protein
MHKAVLLGKATNHADGMWKLSGKNRVCIDWLTWKARECVNVTY